MTEIHVVHKRIGGVGHIARLLEDEGFAIAEPDWGKLALYANDDNVQRIFFHQPFSHLLCLLTVICNPRQRRKMCCILHEASNYNVGSANRIRARLGHLIRFAVIRLCNFIGVEIRGVSEYVCSSYFLKNKKKADFLKLFRFSLEGILHDSAVKENLAVVWLRKGTATPTIRCLADLRRSGYLSGMVVLGDREEVQKLSTEMSSYSILADVPILNSEPSLEQEDFFEFLRRSRWFLSFFPREGFGLSAFQATFFGCIVLASWSGAIAEWLPAENMEILDSLKDGEPTLDFDILSRVSEINLSFARKKLYSEN